MRKKIRTRNKPHEIVYKSTFTLKAFKELKIKEYRERKNKLEKLSKQIDELEKMSDLLKKSQDAEFDVEGVWVDSYKVGYEDGYKHGFEQSTKAFSVLMREYGLTVLEVRGKLDDFIENKVDIHVAFEGKDNEFPHAPVFDLDWPTKEKE